MTSIPTSDVEPRTWQRAPGIVLLGPVSGSGLIQQTYLVQRQDGQMVQLSDLLHLILDTAATARPTPELARTVSDAYGRELSVEGLEHLLATKLVPLGLIEASSGDHGSRDHAARRPQTADPLLALRVRGTLLPARAVNALAAILAPAFFPPVVITALLLLALLDVGLLRTGDALAALDQILVTPVLMLVLFGLLSVGALIHELGHATACYYGGARPGRIGFGLYLVFPAYFTNVTDSYRLGRAGRLRTDLGGLYFNVWCVLAAGAGYLATGQGLLLLVVLLMQLQMLQQLWPVIRLDGYFILADVVGVPDLFARVGPVMRSILPDRAAHPRITELKPAARRIVTVWVLAVVPLLTIGMVVTLWMLPVIVPRTITAITVHAEAAAAAWKTADAAGVAFSALSILFLALPLLGLAVVLTRLCSLLARAARKALARIPATRANKREAGS
jgi:putative peptide zinc metalloprotease protein